MKANEIIAGLRACRSGLPGHCKDCPVYIRHSGCLDRLHTVAADALEAPQKRIEELEAERRWIPVTERLPEEDTQVVAIVSGRWENITFDRACELASWSADEDWIMEAWPKFENPNVTHWMPLPELVKEGV